MASIPTTHIVYRLTEIGSFKNIKAFQEPLRGLEKNEILVKIKAVSLNYRDVIVANGTYASGSKASVIPASDGAGDVVKIGSDIKDFKVGDRVISFFNRSLGATEDGVLSEYRIFTSDSILKIPSDSHLSYEEAASMVVTGTTTWNCLFGGGRPLERGQTVLVLGTGGISITGLVLAKAAGATTIITSSSDEKIKYVKEKYGADHGVNYRTHPDWEKEVLFLTGGKGVDFVIENGGNGTILKSIASVKVGGEIDVLGSVATPPNQVSDILMPIMFKCAVVRGIIVGSLEQSKQLVQFVHDHKLHLPIEATFGSTEEQVHSAYEKLISRTAVGKITIKFD